MATPTKVISRASISPRTKEFLCLICCQDIEKADYRRKLFSSKEKTKVCRDIELLLGEVIDDESVTNIVCRNCASKISRRCFLQAAGEGTVPGHPGTNSNKKRFLNANSNMSGTIWSFSSKCMYTSSLVTFMVIITARFKSVLMKVLEFGFLTCARQQ